MIRSDIQVLIDAIADGVPNTALKVRTILNELADGSAQTGDVKEIDVNTAYIASNFDPSGLGFNEREGWAICNGNNGTRNRENRVSIQYSSTYPVLGAIGGSKDAVVIEHSHTASMSNATGSDVNKFTAQNGGSSGGTTSANGTGTINVSTVGVSGTDKNMQPYIVTLFIMKL